MNNSLMNSLCLFALEKPPEVRNFRLCAGVIHKHKDIVSLGFCRRKTHPLQAQFGTNRHCVFLHAEIDALIKALRVTKMNSKEYSIYIARVKQRGSNDFVFDQGLAQPCIGCTKFIHNCGLKQIYWTLDQKIGYSLV